MWTVAAFQELWSCTLPAPAAVSAHEPFSVWKGKFSCSVTSGTLKAHVGLGSCPGTVGHNADPRASACSPAWAPQPQTWPAAVICLAVLKRGCGTHTSAAATAGVCRGTATVGNTSLPAALPEVEVRELHVPISGYPLLASQHWALQQQQQNPCGCIPTSGPCPTARSIPHCNKSDLQRKWKQKIPAIAQSQGAGSCQSPSCTAHGPCYPKQTVLRRWGVLTKAMLKSLL